MSLQTIETLLKTPTAHSIIDSGDYYGRAYQRNQLRDFDTEPQAVLTNRGVSVSIYHHIRAQLEEDRLCQEFNALPVDDWNSDFYGVSADGQQWLEDRMFSPEGNAQNSYNWENNFDQIVQYQKLERNGDTYILLQIHGGCDVRSGYTDAKLFKFDDWDGDSYWMDDRCTFGLTRQQLHDWFGYEIPADSDMSEVLSVDFCGGQAPEVYDCDDMHPLGQYEIPDGTKIGGSASAVEH